MRSRFVFAVAFATVAPVMSLPAPVQQARDVQNQFPSELGYESFLPMPQTTTPITGIAPLERPTTSGMPHSMNLVPVTHPEQSTTPNNPHFMNLVPVTHLPPAGVVLKRSPDSDSSLPTVDDVTLNVKRNTQTGAGAGIEQRSLESFLNSKPVQGFNDIVSVASIFTMETPKGL